MKKIFISAIMIFTMICTITSSITISGKDKILNTVSASKRYSYNKSFEYNNKIKHKFPDLPAQFQKNSYEHIRKLSSFGMRYAGSKAEKLTVDYISKYMKQLRLDTKVESFKFQYFASKSTKIKMNGLNLEYENVIMNPYKKNKINGKGIFYTADALRGTVPDNKILIVNNQNTNPYDLQKYNLTAEIVVNDKVFKKMYKPGEVEINIAVTGKNIELTSKNVIGTICPEHPSKNEIIISAHWDSYKGPGASDNASGVGVLLELAKYYSSIRSTLPYNIRFVAFGGEELGFLGSTFYTTEHKDELKNCKLVFNIDEVGGNQDTYIEMNGGILKCQNASEMYATTDYNGQWISDKLLSNFAASYVTIWLKDYIIKGCKELNYKFLPGNIMGSDHTSFAKINIPSTNIAIPGNFRTHSPDDSPDKIYIPSLRKAGKIVATIVNKTLGR